MRGNLLAVVVKLAIIISLWSPGLLIDGTSVKCGNAVTSAVRVAVIAGRVFTKHSLNCGLVLVNVHIY